MLDLDFIRNQPELVAAAARDKGVAFSVEQVLAAADRVRVLQRSVDEGQRAKKVIADKFKSATPEEREALRVESSANAETLKTAREELTAARDELHGLLLKCPQVPWSGAPVGASEEDNVVIREWGTPRPADETPVDHVTLLEKRGWADFKNARNVAGERAYVLKGDAVLLERAIISFGIDVLRERGFELASVPAIVREEPLIGTGFLPGHAEEIYRLPHDNAYLAGTAEVALVGLVGDTIHDGADLPITLAGISPCFRREIGSAGRDVRGLIRVHQFEKVEQFVVCKADEAESAKWHAALAESAEFILQSLGLPYQVVECATGDMGLGKVRMNDINTWFPSLGTYRETHSCSTLHEWQARRAGIRYREKDGSIHFAHTLNNTAVATPRLLAALVENAQTAEGGVTVPEPLRPYLGGRETL